MDCSVVFDFRDSGANVFWTPVFALLFVGAGILSVKFRHKFPPRRGGEISAWIFLGFAIVLAAIGFIDAFRDYFSLRAALNRGTYQTVEGVVRNYHSGPHSPDSFDVGNQHFVESDSPLFPGGIQDGMYVVIQYRGGAILRLEVCRPPV